ncbi:MAG: ribosome maturation factor RimP [Actinomycetota bacterium]|nr:ribosome maturation factor RimP [Acidimicrobiia bacterium]MDQ3292979.1 ribosome maturation factor RimP [Actinomycetota bacterium]
MPTIAERVAGIIAPAVEELELALYDIVYAGGVLTILVTSPDGVGIGQIAPLTRAINRLLDEDDPIDGGYTLEVSSPGLERVLRTPAHYVDAIGSTVAVKTVPGTEGERRLEGTLAAADERSITVRFEDGTDRTLDHADIERARTTFAWGPAPKPGSRPAGGKPLSAKPTTDKKAAKR